MSLSLASFSLGFALSGLISTPARTKLPAHSKAELEYPPDPYPLPVDEDAGWGDYKRVSEWLKTYPQWATEPINAAMADGRLTKTEFQSLTQQAKNWSEEFNRIDDERLKQQFLTEIKTNLKNRNDPLRKPE